MKDTHDQVEEGSDNVFADVGLSNPRDLQTKEDLTLSIGELIREGGYDSVQVADILGIAPFRVSELRKGQLNRFSVGDLNPFLLRIRLRLVDSVTEHMLTIHDKLREVGKLRTVGVEQTAKFLDETSVRLDGLRGNSQS